MKTNQAGQGHGGRGMESSHAWGCHQNIIQILSKFSQLTICCLPNLERSIISQNLLHLIMIKGLVYILAIVDRSMVCVGGVSKPVKHGGRGGGVIKILSKFSQFTICCLHSSEHSIISPNLLHLIMIKGLVHIHAIVQIHI